MKVKLYRDSYSAGSEAKCAICGQIYQLQKIRPRVYNDAGISFGDVCLECVGSGPKGFKQRLYAQIEELHTEIRNLKELANEGVDLPSIEEEFELYH